MLADKTEIKNAVIESTMLGLEDHGIMSWYLYLDYGNSVHQGFGGYALDDYNEHLKRRIGRAWGMESISRVLEVVGVSSWEKLKGQYIRVESNFSKCLKIGHIIKDKWFDPQADLKFLIESK